MLTYILQAIVCQLLFLLIYDVFLKRETFFNANRAYLLLTQLLSFLIPLVKVRQFETIIPQEYIVKLPTVFIGEANSGDTQEAVVTLAGNDFSFSWELYFYIGLITALLFALYKAFKLSQYVAKGEKRWKCDFCLVQLNNSKAAFSFLNYVFLGDQIKEDVKTMILKHELVHVRQKHTYDLLFFELLKIIMWFNPLIYLYQNRMAALHEFIADAEAIKQDSKAQVYQNLLSQIFDTNYLPFTNTFYKQSLIKKRIVMINRNKSKMQSLSKYFLVVPVIVILLVFSACERQDFSNENIDLEQYSYTLKVGEEMNSKMKEKHLNYEAFLKENKDYVSWAEIDYDNKEITYSIHSKNEEVPEGYTKTRVESENGQYYLSYFNFKNSGASKFDGAKNYDLNHNSDEIPFSVIDQIPTYAECRSLSHKEQKKCVSDKIAQFVNQNFNIKVAAKSKLEGTQRIITVFKIDKKGNIVNVKARAPHPDLAAEAERVIKLLPKMIPGKHNGENVVAPYSLPILFQVKK